MAPPGWSAFDPRAVAALRRSAKDPDAPCPLVGHDHRIRWAREGYTKGTEYHGSPPVSFRVSPTYVLEDPAENFIVGRELVAKLTSKAEAWRLGNENSEDALSFNVFRSLQEAGMLRDAARCLIGLEFDSEPELIVWGHNLGSTTAQPVRELKTVLNSLEGTAGQQTEPDVILRIPGWGWIFVEAKLASPTSTYRRRKEKLKTWIERYGNSVVFNAAALAVAKAETFPEQLLRNVAVAHAIAEGEHLAVIALVRKVYQWKVVGCAGDFIADTGVITGTATWEELYGLTNGQDTLADLRRYLADKSVNLRRAFAL